jgi:hypothetical protein
VVDQIELEIVMQSLKKFIKWVLIVAVILLGGVGAIFMWDKFNNPVVVYLEDKFHHPGRSFIVNAFKQIPLAQPGQVALILDARVAEKDITLPLEKGYEIVAVDSGEIYYDLMIPDQDKYPDRIKIVKEWGEGITPKVDIVMASFVFPLYRPDAFKEEWMYVDAQLKEGGYFIGNFMHPDSTVFSADRKSRMTFHSKDDLSDLFKEYEILVLEEVNKSIPLKGTDHYFEVLARKKIKH